MLGNVKTLIVTSILVFASASVYAGNDKAADQVVLKNQSEQGSATAVSNVTKEQGGTTTTSTAEKRLLRAK
jgi:hypothetical protein